MTALFTLYSRPRTSNVCRSERSAAARQARCCWLPQSAAREPWSAASRLRGRARAHDCSDAAEAAVSGLTGVRNISDDIEVRSTEETADATRRVQRALDRYGLVGDDSDISVTAAGGTITLAGHVQTWAEHDAVIDAAWRSLGVSDVQDDLLITG